MRIDERDLPMLAQKLKPYLTLTTGGGGSASTGSGMLVHELNGPYHTGQLAQAQAPWAATVTALNAHTTSTGDVHPQYVLETTTLTAGNGLTGGGTLAANRTFNVAVSGLGLGVGADAVTLTSSSNPGSAASILASDGAGGLTLVDLIATTKVRTPLIDTAAGNLALSPATGITTLSELHASTRLRSDLVDTAANSLTLSPAGTAVLPTSSIVKDLGDYNRKWRTLYAAELYVETLVAQDVLATIGGRIMVAPTTKLIADVSAGATTIDVEHNNLHGTGPLGAYVYLSSAPGGVAQVEVMKVANANPTAITGGYRYTVTRNVDGSGANSWVAGDAVASTGWAAGQGWIDLTSTSTARSHLGPTITVYARTGVAAWTDVKPVTSMGNLRSFVDYGSDQYGFALGNDLTLLPTTGFSGMTADRTDGLRLFNTDIALYSGASKLLGIDVTTGISIQQNSGFVDTRAYKFVDSSTVLGGLYGDGAAAGNAQLALQTRSLTSGDATIYVRAYGGSGSTDTGVVHILSRGEGRFANLYVNSTYSGREASQILLGADYVTVDGVLEVDGYGITAPPGTYGSLALTGSKGSYAGIELGASSGDITMMFNTGSETGGFYRAAATAKWLLYWNGTEWHAGASSGNELWMRSNDGTGSGLDADLLDGVQGASFLRSDAADTATGLITASAGIDSGVAYKRDGTAGGIFVPVTPVNLTDGGSVQWAGAASKTTGTYTFDLGAAANGSVPAEAVAVCVLLSGQWAAAASASYCLLRPRGGAGVHSGIIRATAAAIPGDLQCIVATDATYNDIEAVVNNATMTNGRLTLLGYFL